MITQDNNIDYNSAFIPGTHKAARKEPFDTKEMKRLYQRGYEQAKKGYPWQKFPPLYQCHPPCKHRLIKKTPS